MSGKIELNRSFTDFLKLRLGIIVVMLFLMATAMLSIMY